MKRCFSGHFSIQLILKMEPNNNNVINSIEEESISEIEIFETIVMTLYYIDKNNEKKIKYSKYSRMMIDCIIEYPDKESIFIQTLAKYIYKNLSRCKPIMYMSHNDIMETISELSDYATIFVYKENYKHIYEDICNIILDIRNMYSTPPMDWKEIQKASINIYID